MSFYNKYLKYKEKYLGLKTQKLGLGSLENKEKYLGLKTQNLELGSLERKQKYLNLKNQLGGNPPRIFDPAIPDNNKYQTNDINSFHSILNAAATPNHLTMVVGIDIHVRDDFQRNYNLDNIDVGVTESITDNLNTFNPDDIKWFQLGINLSNIDKEFVKDQILNRNPDTIRLNTQKFSRILFDASTIGHLNILLFIFYAYYILLEENGTLYLPLTMKNNEENREFIQNLLNNYHAPNIGKVYYMMHPSHIANIDQILTNNQIYLHRVLQNSKIEIKQHTYPINDRAIIPVCDVDGYYFEIIKGNIELPIASKGEPIFKEIMSTIYISR